MAAVRMRHAKHVRHVTLEIPSHGYARAMKQIRIASTREVAQNNQGQRFVCEWMEGSLMNRWLLKNRLAEALEVHGTGSHWVEVRDAHPVRHTAPA